MAQKTKIVQAGFILLLVMPSHIAMHNTNNGGGTTQEAKQLIGPLNNS